jgi:nucleoside-diphosphate-sugar epimerase
MDDERPEALAAPRPLDAYGWKKHFVDDRIPGRCRGPLAGAPQWAGLKFFNVYGPSEDYKGERRSLVDKLMPVVKAGEPVGLFRPYHSDYPDGGQMRDFVYVDDVAGVIRWLAGAGTVSGLFNIGAGRARTLERSGECAVRQSLHAAEDQVSRCRRISGRTISISPRRRCKAACRRLERAKHVSRGRRSTPCRQAVGSHTGH